MLNVDHDDFDPTAARRAIQPFVATITAKENSFVLIPRDLYQRWTDYGDSLWTDEELDLLAADVDAMAEPVGEARERVGEKVAHWRRIARGRRI